MILSAVPNNGRYMEQSKLNKTMISSKAQRYEPDNGRMRRMQGHTCLN